MSVGNNLNISDLLFELKEPYAAGLFEYLERGDVYRYCNAFKRFLEAADFSPYDGGNLFPCGKCSEKINYNMAVYPNYSNTFLLNYNLLKNKTEAGLEIILNELRKVSGFENTPHTIGGAGYTHSFINYSRILNDGLYGYRQRIEKSANSDFKDGLLLLLDGIEIYRKRLISHLKVVSAPQTLINALELVPNNPPQNIYEAVVAWNFMYYIDGCDDIGRLDANLIKYYNGEDIVDLLKELYSHVNINDGWSGALGPDYNVLTVQCIKAVQNTRRPNLQLRVKPDMPEEIWNEVYDALATSCGQPALYNELLYQERLKTEFPEIPEEDLERLSFGGCTETMLEGISNVGSDDAGIHLALIFDKFTHENLYKYNTFDEYFSALLAQIYKEVEETLIILNNHRKTRALYRPQPVRTLLIDDCIDKQLDFNNGGARYYWSVINVSGLINVVDSLLVIRALIYEQKKYSAVKFIEALDNRDEEFIQSALKCPCYGVDDDNADYFAADFISKVYDSFNMQPCYPSGKFFPVSNQFITFEYAGHDVAATPDGRGKSEPLCDSISAIHGKDIKGPTALLNSVAKAPFYRALGTPVMNFKMKKEHLYTHLKPLAEGFFKKGGMQMQISCVSRDDMLDAIGHPEKHENLIVRIGGYSEYFNRLSHALKEDMLKRTEY